MNESFYEHIILTEEEIKAAIIEAKVKKYFHEKHKDYWESQESASKKSSHKVVNEVYNK